MELRGLENTGVELSSDKQANYKKLYHESVERCAILQSQLESYSSLFTKMGRIEQLKVETTLHNVQKLRVRDQVFVHFSGVCSLLVV